MKGWGSWVFNLGGGGGRGLVLERRGEVRHVLERQYTVGGGGVPPPGPPSPPPPPLLLCD